MGGTIEYKFFFLEFSVTILLRLYTVTLISFQFEKLKKNDKSKTYTFLKNKSKHIRVYSTT